MVFKRILIFWFLFIIVLALPIQAEQDTKPVATTGLLNMEDWNFEDRGAINLDGEWEFYWNRLLSPKDFSDNSVEKTGYLDFPKFWNGFKVNGKELGGIGYATFRMKIVNLDDQHIYSLSIPLMHTAYTLWANGKILSSNGVVGKTKETETSQYLPKVVSITSPESKSIEFVLQVSNHSHRNGGVWQSIEMDIDTKLQNKEQTKRALELFLMGAIFIMGLYHLGLYALRRTEGTTLAFGIFCLIIAFRISVHGSTIFSVLFPDFNWELLAKLDYFTLYFGLASLSTFIQLLYPTDFPKRVLRVIQLVSGGFALFTVVTPGLIYTNYLVHFQIFAALSCIYVIFILILATVRKREGAVVVTGGWVILFAAAINDTLYYRDIINSIDLVGAGLFMMIFSQSFVLSLRFSKAFQTVEVLSKELEQKVKERTAAIKDLLDNTGQGFFSFSNDFIIQKHTSKATEEFFKKPIQDEDAIQLMFPEDYAAHKETLSLIFSDPNTLEMLQPILPIEFNRENRIYSVAYHWIKGKNNNDRIMIVLTDITAQRLLEQRLEEDEEQNKMIVKIAVDRHGFLSFLSEIKRIQERIEEIFTLPVDQISANELFRHFHTFKGGMASYSFNKVSKKAHQIESRLEEYRQGTNKINSELITTLKSETTEMINLIEETLDNLQLLLPKEFLQVSDKNYFRISEEKIISLEESLNEIASTNEAIRKAVVNLRKQPVRNLLKKFASDAVELADNLEKKVSVNLKGEETEIIHTPYKPFFSSLVHLIRNSIDHGIEAPDVRSMLGKNEEGILNIEFLKEDSNLVIKISDDGGGIDSEKIKKIAFEKGLISEDQSISMTEKDIIRLIFAPGFSTNEEVSDLSGRGVGMDAVLQEVEALNGTIDVSTALDKGSTFTIIIPE